MAHFGNRRIVKVSKRRHLRHIRRQLFFRHWPVVAVDGFGPDAIGEVERTLGGRAQSCEIPTRIRSPQRPGGQSYRYPNESGDDHNNKKRDDKSRTALFSLPIVHELEKVSRPDATIDLEKGVELFGLAARENFAELLCLDMHVNGQIRNCIFGDKGEGLIFSDRRADLTI